MTTREAAMNLFELDDWMDRFAQAIARTLSVNGQVYFSADSIDLEAVADAVRVPYITKHEGLLLWLREEATRRVQRLIATPAPGEATGSARSAVDPKGEAAA